MEHYPVNDFSMEFVKMMAEGREAEFTLDADVYSKSAILKTAYLFLDRGYFLFANAPEGFAVRCKTKRADDSAEDLAGDFANELLNTVLRETVALENRAIRETIYSGALAHCFREPEELSCKTSPAPALEKDLDQILKEIENELGLESEASTKTP